jgi:hypothetical protein
VGKEGSDTGETEQLELGIQFPEGGDGKKLRKARKQQFTGMETEHRKKDGRGGEKNRNSGAKDPDLAGW